MMVMRVCQQQAAMSVPLSLLPGLRAWLVTIVPFTIVRFRREERMERELSRILMLHSGKCIPGKVLCDIFDQPLDTELLADHLQVHRSSPGLPVDRAKRPFHDPLQRRVILTPPDT